MDDELAPTNRFDVRLSVLETKVEERDKALGKQATEYERRLKDLNNEASRIQDVLNRSVTAEKFEDYVKNEADKTAAALDQEEQKRVLALERVDEKFDEYVKRYEQRQRDIDNVLAAQKGAAEEARRIAEDSARKTREESETQWRQTQKESQDQARITQRNTAVMGALVIAVIALAQYLGAL